MISKAISALGAAAVLAACSQGPPPAAPAPMGPHFVAVADSIVNRGMSDMHWGIEVFDQGRNRFLYSHDSPRKFIPASNTKLVVTTVAMGLLGPDWRYTTTFGVAGAAGDTSVRALVIRASGDPTWSARFFSSDFAVLDMFADSLARNGIRRIDGDVIVDASIFAPQRVHPAWEIGDLPWYYAAPTAAFAVAEAAVTMIVESNASGSVVRVPDAPMLLPIVNRVRMDTAGARRNVDIDYEAWPATLTVTGSMPPNAADTSFIAIPNLEEFSARALVEALKRHGIVVTGSARIVRDSAALAALPSARNVFAFQSPPMKDVVAGILKPSQNWIAEQLLKTLGAVNGRRGSWSGGLQVERRYLIDVVRIDSTQFSLSDGSGLSAQNVISPHALIELLEHARKAPWGQLYHNALPTPGRRVQGANIGAGTLTNRLLEVEGRLAAKTGTITNVNSLSGYLRNAEGRDITFSIMTNTSGRSSAEVRRAMDAIVKAIAAEKIPD